MARSPIGRGYQPLTWQNVSTDPLNAAIGAFDKAGESSRQFAQDMFGLQDRLDAQLTNRLLGNVTRTGRLPTEINPRADQAKLYEAFNTVQTDQSNLQTASVNRRKAGAEADLFELEVEDFPAKIKRLEAEHEAKLADIEAARQRNKISALEAETRRQALEHQLNQSRSDAQYAQAVGGYRQSTLPTLIEALKQEHPDWDPRDIEDEANAMLDEDVSRKFNNYFFAQQLPEGADLAARERSALGTVSNLAQETAAEIAKEQAKLGLGAEADARLALEAFPDNPKYLGISRDGSFYVDSKNRAVTQSEGRSIATQATLDANGNSYLNFDDLEGDLKTSFYDAITSYSPSVARRLVENTTAAIQETGGERSVQRFAKEFAKQANLLRAESGAWVDSQLGQGGPTGGDKLNAALAVDGAAGGTNAEKINNLVPRIEEILKRESGTDTANLDLVIHPDRTVSATDVSRLTKLIKELETQRKDGGRLPLSTQQLADRREALDLMLQALSSPPPPPLPTQFNRNPIEPK